MAWQKTDGDRKKNLPKAAALVGTGMTFRTLVQKRGKGGVGVAWLTPQKKGGKETKITNELPLRKRN